MNEKQAMKKIDEVCKWLEAGAPGAEPRELLWSTIQEKVARDMCHKLLNAADADGLGGCQLCQS